MGRIVHVAGRACVTGIDVSNHQRTVDHQAVAAAGHSFIIAKATEGVGFRDGWYRANRDGTLAAGLIFGAYHWLKPNHSARNQAAYFLSATDNAAGCTLAVLDAEEAGITNEQCVEWCQIVRDACPHATVVIYCGAFTDPRFRSMDWLEFVPWLAAYPAGYATDPDPAGLRQPVAPQPWGAWTVWQYTSSGRVPGVEGNCDVNVADALWFSSLAAPQEDDVPLTPDDLDAIALRVRDVLVSADPNLNPGVVIDPAARQAIASIQTAIVDPETGVRALLAASRPASADSDAIAAAVIDALGDELAGEVVAAIGRKLAAQG